MAFTSVNKEKNLVLFHVDNARAYSLDINTGIWYGLRGKPLNGSSFAGLSQYLGSCGYDSYNVIYLLNRIYSYPRRFGLTHTPKMSDYAQFAEYFKIVDRLESIGYKEHYNSEYEPTTLKKISQYFKPFAKWLKDNKGKKFSEFIKEREYTEWISNHRLVPNNHGLTETLIKKLWENRDRFEDDKIDYVVYYATHGLMDWYNIEDVNLTSRFSYGQTSEWNRMFDKIASYLKLCKDMEVKPEKENMLQLYVNLRRTYITNRKAFDAKALKNWYNKFPMLQFEDDTFTVVIPQTREDFINEANAQNNCVYSYYFEPVTKNETLVVFIRYKNNPNKSYITCEISPVNGTIRQYLTVNNNSVKDCFANSFKAKYMSHLSDNWNRGN